MALWQPAQPRAEVSSEAFDVATYNVHRWSGGVRHRDRFDPAQAQAVIARLDAPIVALQEVLIPLRGRDPLTDVIRDEGVSVAFVATRPHRNGMLGNAILSRWRVSSSFVVNLSLGRLERRAALVVQFERGEGQSPLSIVSTHLAIVDRTRQRQVEMLLEHPQLQGPVVLLGDMNAWRRCSATRSLEREFEDRHNNASWPASFPATRPLLALDRIYARGLSVASIRAVDTPEARFASDHLPVWAHLRAAGA
jgi:endonuclease/exonuclease/phosphatase family metal-dependent hydrolase